MKRLTLVVLAAGLAAGSGAKAVAQGMMDPEAEKARQLVERIRRGMREIDNLLLSGADSEVTEEEIEANIRRLEELLEEAESKSKMVVESIDELIQLAKYQRQNNPQGGGGDDSPPPPEGSQPQRPKSQDPEQLQQQHSPSGEDQQQGSEQEEPTSPRPDSQPPDQRDASGPPPGGESGQFERVDTTGRWGVLPPKEAEDLQRHNVDDFPQRYRPYMEMYYRRVNRLKSQRAP